MSRSALIDLGDEIFTFHDTAGTTNGRLEDTNAKLGVLKSIAYGFVSATNFGHRAILLPPPWQHDKPSNEGSHPTPPRGTI